MSNELKKFIESQNEKAKAASSVDWGKRKEKWLDSLKEVFAQISEWLQQAGLSQESIVSGSRELNEETLGRYDAPTLSVNLPGETTIDFIPVGSVIIGGYGRVDVTARRGLQKLYLIAVDLDEKSRAPETRSYEREWVWRIFEPGNPRKSIEFDQKGLTELLTRLSG